MHQPVEDAASLISTRAAAALLRPSIPADCRAQPYPKAKQKCRPGLLTRPCVPVPYGRSVAANFTETEMTGPGGAYLHVLDRSTGMEYNCNITGDYMNCPPHLYEETPLVGGAATLRVYIYQRGRFVNRANFNMDEVGIRAECDGNQDVCAQVGVQNGAAFPCTSYGSTWARAAPGLIHDGDYLMAPFGWADDSCNLAEMVGIPGCVFTARHPCPHPHPMDVWLVSRPRLCRCAGLRSSHCAFAQASPLPVAVLGWSKDGCTAMRQPS